LSALVGDGENNMNLFLGFALVLGSLVASYDIVDTFYFWFSLYLKENLFISYLYFQLLQLASNILLLKRHFKLVIIYKVID
jgi:hypothetical protein